jgi:hypothetical protein
MSLRSLLRRNVTEESPAYGYTLAIWGSGALLLTQYSITGVTIMAYVLGGIIAFGVLSALAFGNLMTEIKEKNSKELAVSMIHLIAAFGAVGLNFLFLENLGNTLTHAQSGFVAGFIATSAYNALLLVEHYVYEDLYEIENHSGNTEKVDE